MIILPTIVEQSGPGIDLSNQPAGLSVQMSDPGAGFAVCAGCGVADIRSVWSWTPVKHWLWGILPYCLAESALWSQLEQRRVQ